MKIPMTKYKVITVHNTYYWTTDITAPYRLYEHFCNLVVKRNRDDRIIDVTVMKTKDVVFNERKIER